jgi:hypothetical protein
MQDKAKKGDPQAKRDVNAVRAGKVAVHSKGRAARNVAARSRREAMNKRGIAVRKRMEARAANALIRRTRARKLAKIAKVERRAAAGDRKAKAAIEACIAKAGRGDQKAHTTVQALRLARHVRTSAKTPAEARRLKAAHKILIKAHRGNKKALRTVALINSAAKSGQPNARRAKARLAVAARVEHAISTGRVVPPGSKATVAHNARSAHARRYEHLSGRVASGIGTREEALGAAKAAAALGKKDEAAALALHARSLPSATQPIKNAAAVQAAAEKGNKEAQAAIADSLAAAQAGDPKGISSAGKLAAIRAVAAVDRGEPMPRPIAEATGIVERAHAGDPEAKRIVARAGEQAQAGDPTAVEAAVALTAASAVLAATAARSGANEHWKSKAREARGQAVETGERGKVEAELAELLSKLHAGTATYREGVRARELAMALGKPQVAAEISSIMPPRDFIDTPLSSLPETPLPKITGVWSFLKEAARALLLATEDPLQNYREGVSTRGETPMFGPEPINKPKA